MQHSWISKYPGLSYSASQDGAYCLRGRALHQWTKEAKNVPQVNNDGGKDEWIGPASCT